MKVRTTRAKRLEVLETAAMDCLQKNQRLFRRSGSLRGARLLCQLAHDCYDKGVSPSVLKTRVFGKLEGEPKPFWDLLNKIWDLLGPVLVELLRSLI